MGGFEQVAWFPLCAGLTAIGLVASWLLWRRRGAASGLRLFGWSLLPLAAYLTGVVGVLWDVGTTIAAWAAGVIISPLVWAGIALAGVAAVAFVVSGVIRGRSVNGRSRKGAADGTGSLSATTGDTATMENSSHRKVGAGTGRTGQAGKESTATDDEDLSDVEEILRRRGIT